MIKWKEDCADACRGLAAAEVFPNTDYGRLIDEVNTIC